LSNALSRSKARRSAGALEAASPMLQCCRTNAPTLSLYIGPMLSREPCAGTSSEARRRLLLRLARLIKVCLASANVSGACGSLFIGTLAKDAKPGRSASTQASTSRGTTRISRPGLGGNTFHASRSARGQGSESRSTKTKCGMTQQALTYFGSPARTRSRPRTTCRIATSVPAPRAPRVVRPRRDSTGPQRPE
jgi:hypothetical protein